MFSLKKMTSKNAKKKILFLTGTRADYGKLKPLILSALKIKKIKIIILVTGMHLSKQHGYTYYQIKKDFERYKKKKEIIKFNNSTPGMASSLAVTIKNIDQIIKRKILDMVVVHGDRIEALGCSIASYLNGLLVAHIEGGEVSGSYDESMRHATSKMSHIHFVSNSDAKRTLVQLGEEKKNIYVIGSPEVDSMMKKNLPNINTTKKKYEIKFDKYCILSFHPDLNESKKALKKNLSLLLSSLKRSKRNFVVIFPNNDPGFDIISNYYKKLKKNKFFKILPSMRFENYLSLLKHADCIIGNSSSGVREAPYYNKLAFNLGNRQNKRTKHKKVVNLKTYNFQLNKLIMKFSNKQNLRKNKNKSYFGHGNSKDKFLKILKTKKLWTTDKNKFLNKREFI